MQATEVDLPGPQQRRRPRAPSTEGPFVCVADGDGLAAALEAVAPLHGQRRPARAAVGAVAPLVAVAQPQRRACQLRADLDAAAAVAWEGLLLGEPGVEAGLQIVGSAPIPAGLVVVEQLQGHVAGRPLRADPTALLAHPFTWPHGWRR